MTDHKIYAGNKKLMDKFGIGAEEVKTPGTIVHVVDSTYLGHIIIKDEVKEESEEEVIKSLKDLGLETIMLTGDNESVASQVARGLGIDTYKAGLLLLSQGKDHRKLYKHRRRKGKNGLCWRRRQRCTSPDLS